LLLEYIYAQQSRSIVVVLPAAQLEEISIRMVHPVGGRELHCPLPFGLLDLPLLDVQLHFA